MNASQPLLEIDDLVVEIQTEQHDIVLARGEVLAVVRTHIKIAVIGVGGIRSAIRARTVHVHKFHLVGEAAPRQNRDCNEKSGQLQRKGL